MTIATRDSGPSRRLRIGEVARMTGVPVKTIRFYADSGILPPASTSAAGYREFGAAEVWRLEVIRVLRSVGFGLDQIREVLDRTDGVGEAVALQRRAIADRIAALRQSEAILAQVEERIAAGSLDETDSLDYIRRLAETMASDAATRNAWLSGILDWIAGGGWTSEPGEPDALWRQSDASPPDPARAAALTDLRRDLPNERAETDDEGPSRFRSFLDESDGSPDEWADDYAAIGERMRDAADRGEPADGPVAQAILDDWLAMFACSPDESVDADLIRWLADAAPTWVAPGSESERFWRAAHGSSASPHERGEALLLDALAVRRRTLD